MHKTPEGWKNEYIKRNAFWLHDGDPKRPHAELTSGLHSNGFFNSRLIIEDDTLMNEVASDLIDLCRFGGGDLKLVDVVVGPQTGGTKLAKMIADILERQTRREVLWVSPAKTADKSGMVLSDVEKAVLPGRRALLCDDVLTTSGSVAKAAAAVESCGAKVMSSVLVIVNRSGFSITNHRAIVSLVSEPMPMWGAECPLCKKGSEAIRPKEPADWARLTAEYCNERQI